jgi:hypothetical protein
MNFVTYSPTEIDRVYDDPSLVWEAIRIQDPTVTSGDNNPAYETNGRDPPLGVAQELIERVCLKSFAPFEPRFI